MSQVLRSLAVGAALLGLGSAAGWWFRGPAKASTREPLPAAAPLPNPRAVEKEPRDRVIVQTLDKSAIRDSVREAIGDELAALRAEEDEAAAPAPEPETLLALDTGQQYVGQAIGRGRWSADDAARVRDFASELSGEQYQELIRPLAIAINEGRVEVEVEGPPF